MKNIFDRKQMLFLGAVVLLLVVVFLIMNFANPTQNLVTNPPVANPTEIEKRITWNQAQLAVSTFTTREDPEGQLLEDKQNVHVIMTSFFSLTSTHPMTKMNIKLVEFTSGVGTPVFVFPTHNEVSSSRSYIYTDATKSVKSQDIVDGGKKLEFKIVSTTPKYYDELMSGGGIPNFAFVIKDIGTLYEQQILKQSGVYESGKSLQYLGVKADKLNGDIVFDVTITFEDGKAYTKRFSGVIDGAKILTETFYQIDMK